MRHSESIRKGAHGCHGTAVASRFAAAVVQRGQTIVKASSEVIHKRNQDTATHSPPPLRIMVMTCQRISLSCPRHCPCLFPPFASLVPLITPPQPNLFTSQVKVLPQFTDSLASAMHNPHLHPSHSPRSIAHNTMHPRNLPEDGEKGRGDRAEASHLMILFSARLARARRPFRSLPATPQASTLNCTVTREH